MTKKKRKFNQNSAIRSAIRRVFSRSPLAIETLEKARRERPWYKKDGTQAVKPRVEFLCSSCNEWFMRKDIQVDHDVPVIDPVKGFEGWEIFVERLFCDPNNLKTLCLSCHKNKTDEEKRVRAINRKKAKQP